MELVDKSDKNSDVQPTRTGHEISDDFDREMSVVEKVLAAAAARRKKEQSKAGASGKGSGAEVWCSPSLL